MSTFGERIQQLRLEKNISQNELSKIIGLHHSNIGRMEKDSQTPSADIIIKLKNYFNVSYDWLLEGKIEPLGLNDDEQALLNTYRECNASDKKEIISFAGFKRSSREN